MSLRTKNATVTTTAGAYSANDVVGGLIPVNMGMGEGFLDDIVIIDVDDVGATLNVYVFDSAPTSISDNAAFSLSDADAKKLIAQFLTINSYRDVGGAKVVSLAEFFTRASLARPFTNRTLYLYLECTGTPTYTSTAGLYLRLTAHS